MYAWKARQFLDTRLVDEIMLLENISHKGVGSMLAR